MGAFMSRSKTIKRQYTSVANVQGNIIRYSGNADGRTTELSSSSTVKKIHVETPKAAPVSHRQDQSKASFLDLPPEIRNHIYSLLLIHEDYIRPKTKIPALRIFQVSKQIHEEAASIFYAANSFYGQWESRLALEDALSTEASLLPCIYDDTQKLPTLSAHWPTGIFWPAPRYYIFLTRIVIDSRIPVPLRSQDGRFMAVEKTIRDHFSRLHVEMAALWAAKQRTWSGKLIGSRLYSPVMMNNVSWLNFTLAFSEDEEELMKLLVRGYRRLG